MGEPQLSDIARRFAALAPEKRRPFLEKAAAAGIDVAGLPVPAGIAGEGWSVASRAQMRLWFLWRLDPTDPAYHLCAAIGLQGPLDPEALRRSLDVLIARHDALRTRFRQQDGSVEQQAAPAEPMPLPTTDLGALPEPERDAALARLVAAERETPFDLEAGPVLRARLIRLGPQEHRLHLTIHHIAADGWSMGLLVAELGRVYAAIRDGQTPALAGPPVRYADYALWEHLLLDAGACDGRIASRRAALAGAEEELPLPFDRPRPERASHRGGSAAFDLDGGDTARLKRLAAEQRATPFAVIAAAFALFLHRYAGGAVPSLGAPSAGRTGSDLEPVVGFFVNMHVLRTALRPDWSFARLVREMRETVAEAHAQDVPFDGLVNALQPSRDLSRNPLFQASVSHEIAPGEPWPAGGLTWSEESEASGSCRFDLELTTLDRGQGTLSGSLRYAAELFDAETGTAMAERFADLLRRLLAEPDRLVGTLGLVGAPESDAIESAPPFESVVSLIEARAMRRPDAVAGGHPGRLLSYRDLVAEADRLASSLRASGIGPGDIVGVAMERTPDLVVALLAVLKTGAAYLPLDPDHPPQRLAAMLQDAGARLVLSLERLAPSLTPAGIRVRCLDGAEPIVEGEDIPIAAPHPASLAYVIYTSGSTGTPKGVAVAHGPLSMHCRAVNRLYCLDARDRELHVASIGFDIAHERWIAPLIAGASLVFGSGRDEAVEDLVRRIGEQSITTLFLPPAYVEQLVGALRRSRERLRLRALIVGGEAWSRESVAATRAALDVDRLVNAYGPTETVIAPLAWLGSDLSGLPGPSAPIGFAVGCRRAVVLDGDGHGVPAGVVGELFVCGEGLARGYLGRPGLTAERFLPDPSGEPGSRMYRTGDRACRRPDGTVLYRGRADDQVKIRGHRIEPAEVEARLMALPGVAAAAVIARPGPAGLRLLAYAVPKDGATLDGAGLGSGFGSGAGTGEGPETGEAARGGTGEGPASTAREGTGDGGAQGRAGAGVGRGFGDGAGTGEGPEAGDAARGDGGDSGGVGAGGSGAGVVLDGSGLRSGLARVLPDYMVPARVIVLARLPLGLNGKIDRKALPEPNDADGYGEDGQGEGDGWDGEGEDGRDGQGQGQDGTGTDAGSGGGTGGARRARGGAPSSPAEVVLAGIWAQVLGLERVGRGDDFFALGGDSIVSLQVVSRARRAGLRLEPRDVFRHRSLAALAAAARPDGSAGGIGQGRDAQARDGEGGGGRGASGDVAEPAGPVPLLPIQAAFFAQAMPERHHWNQAVLLVPHGLPDWPVIAKALDALVTHHPALRMRFRQGEDQAEGQAEAGRTEAGVPGGWIARGGPLPQDPERLRVVSAPDADAVTALCAEAQASLDLGSGRLLRGLGIDLPDGSRRLLIAIHHLAVDGVSWRILLEDLESACAQLMRGAAVGLPRGEGEAASGIAAWAARLQACAGTRALEAELGYWLGQAGEGGEGDPARLPGDPIPESSPAESLPATVAEGEEERLALTQAETATLFGPAQAAYRTQANDLLLAALMRAVGRWRDEAGQEAGQDAGQGIGPDAGAAGAPWSPDLLIELEGHGREDLTDAEEELGAALGQAGQDSGGRDGDGQSSGQGSGQAAPPRPLDLSRMVGWLTSAFPLRLPGAHREDAGALIKAVKEAVRAVPRRGLGYGLLARLGDEKTRAGLARLPEPRLSFNYLGRFDASLGGDAPFALAPESPGPALAASSPLTRPLAIDASVREGRLLVSLSYARTRFTRDGIARLAALYGQALRELTDHCLSGAAGLTPSDVPLARLDQDSLDGLGLDARAIEDLYPLTPMQQGILFHALEAGEGAQTRAGADAADEGEDAGKDGEDAGRSDVYVNQLCATVHGLEANRFQDAWAAVGARHPVLRTSFLREGPAGSLPAGVPGGALQLVHRAPPLPFTHEDWRGQNLAPAEETDRLARLARTERARGFDLARAPLQRVRLVRLADGAGSASAGASRHRLIWTSHHILLDGWSCARFLSEVLAHYRGTPPATPPGLYRDYVAWLLDRQDRAEAQAFWTRELAPLDAPTRLADAFDPEPGAEAQGEGMGEGTGEGAGENTGAPATRELVLDLDAPASASLRAFARAEGLTLNTLVQGAFALLLARFTGQDSVCFGATVSGRPEDLPGAEETLGLFINTLPVTQQARPDSSARAWLRDLQERNLALREHGHVPLARLQRIAGHPGQALFDALLVFENYPVDEALRAGGGSEGEGAHGTEAGTHGQEAGGAAHAPRFTEVAGAESANYPLMLTVSAGHAPAQGLRLHLQAHAHRFGPDRLALIADTLAHLLQALARAIARDPATPLGDIPTIPSPAADGATGQGKTGEHTAGERTAAGDAAAAPLPVHLAFARQARERPHAEALRCGTESLTYAELDAKAARLAQALTAHGVGSGDRVGIALPRTPALIVALLAVLKTGAAYAPLDPDHPPTRTARTAAEAALRLILAEPALRARIPDPPCQILAPHELTDEAANAQESSHETGQATGQENRPDTAREHRDDGHPVHPEDLAYVIHTSGSTGTPKGVMVGHRALANILASMARVPGMGASDTVLAITALSFDIAVLELLLPLSLGARILLADRDTARDSDSLLALARANAVDVIQATPSTWRMLAARDGLDRLPPGCRRWCGGEALPADLAARLAGKPLAGELSADPASETGKPLTGETGAVPGDAPIRAWNLYGPTETTVWSACTPLPPVEEGAPPPEPTLGDPVAKTRLHVLGPDLHPAPDGVRGELFIGGAGLARGYHGRPGLTAERFLPDPFGEPGARLYRTGDIACRSGSALRYRGRADDQVKIRGHRIEPGEVEARLLALPGVAAAAVIARPGPAGLRLIAYAVPTPGASLDEAGLRASLTGSLPDPMIPARIAVLAALPITQNGKLDRRALPDPDTTDPTDPATPRAEPQTQTERTLAHIWTTVLGLTHVNTTDAFFDIGGDSISAMQVVAAIRARFDRELPLRRLFETPTIAALAAELDRAAPPAARSDDIAAMLDTLDILEFADE